MDLKFNANIIYMKW